jgi:hypothetical protein
LKAPPGRTSRRAVSLLATAALAIAVVLASCTPAPRGGPGAPDLRDLATRYRAQRDAREERLAAVRIEATTWIDAASIGRLPAVQLDVALVRPDHVRARVASLFGTALDLLVRGDSLTASVPPRRMGVELGSLQDSLGIRRPGEWACRALAATWDPRGARWVTGAADSLRHASWAEEGDSLRLDVDSKALPVAVVLRSTEGRTLTIRYPAWQWIETTAWPSRIEIEDAAAGVQVALRVDRVRFEHQADPQWMVLVVPASAQRLDWRSLREALARMGGVR